MKVKAKIYDYHMDYDADIDVDLLNMKIRIYDGSYQETGKALYEGSIGKFIKERVPSDFLVNMLTELKHHDKVTYSLSGGENYIERIR